MFGYMKEKATDHILNYWDLNEKPEDTGLYEFVECEESEKPDLYEPAVYTSDALISWAMTQVFSEALIPHMAAFLDFANKMSLVAKTNFLTYAAAVGLTDTANAIIAKAVELGADIN